MEAVQVYKTEDGKMFDTAEEAASHEDSVAAKAKMGTTLIAAAPLDRRVGHQAMATPDGFCKRECPYMDVWQHPFYHHTAWCWKQMRDLGYYDGLIADCMHREPDERLARLPADMLAPNV